MDASTGRFRYHGKGGDLLGMVLVNFLFTVLTLGIYSFWAKNKVREFHYSHTELDGDRFAYHGTGAELLRGALLAAGVFIVLGIAYAVVVALVARPDASPVMQTVVLAAFYLAIIPLVIYAINSARRYRLSRSSWRGIRFSFHGEAGEFFILMFKGVVLSIITLGLYTPLFQNQRRKFLVDNARFGSEPFMYIGDGRPLFGQFLTSLLLTIPTLGFSWIWYSAFKHRYFWNNTRMRGARFESNVKGWDLLELQFTNMILVMFTLGIGAPWAITRTHEFFCDRLALVGTVDWASIQQRAQAESAVGEGMAEGLDVDVGI